MFPIYYIIAELTLNQHLKMEDQLNTVWYSLKYSSKVPKHCSSE